MHFQSLLFLGSCYIFLENRSTSEWNFFFFLTERMEQDGTSLVQKNPSIVLFPIGGWTRICATSLLNIAYRIICFVFFSVMGCKLSYLKLPVSEWRLSGLLSEISVFPLLPPQFSSRKRVRMTSILPGLQQQELLVHTWEHLASGYVPFQISISYLSGCVPPPLPEHLLEHPFIKTANQSSCMQPWLNFTTDLFLSS